MIHTVILAIYKKSNIFIVRKFCKRTHFPAIGTLALSAPLLTLNIKLSSTSLYGSEHLAVMLPTQSLFNFRKDSPLMAGDQNSGIDTLYTVRYTPILLYTVHYTPILYPAQCTEYPMKRSLYT